jgi:hypothetical protein
VIEHKSFQIVGGNKMDEKLGMLLENMVYLLKTVTSSSITEELTAEKIFTTNPSGLLAIIVPYEFLARGPADEKWGKLIVPAFSEFARGPALIGKNVERRTVSYTVEGLCIGDMKLGLQKLFEQERAITYRHTFRPTYKLVPVYKVKE